MPEHQSTEAYFILFYFKECTIVQCEGLQWKAAGKTRYELVKVTESNEQRR